MYFLSCEEIKIFIIIIIETLAGGTTVALALT